MQSSSTKTVVRGALILTIAGLMSKVLSAIYRIPLQNLTGDLGFYLYQQVYPFIGTVMILALYGFPVAVSKLVAETNEERKNLTWNTFYRPLFIVLFLINGTIFCILFISAPLIAQISGDVAFTSVYRTVAFLFLFVPFISLVRGAFQGIGDMKQTAYSQIIEQMVRVTLIILAAYFVYIGKVDVGNIGFAGVLATLTGMVVVTMYLLICFRKQFLRSPLQPRERTVPWRYFFYICMTFGIVASLNQLILIFIQFADVLTLVPNLMSHGYSLSEAREWKGIFDRGQPLIQFGVVFGSSFALALTPAIAKQQSDKSLSAKAETIQDAVSLSFYLALGASVGLVLILEQANVLLFMNDAGTLSLQILATSIFFTSMSITGSAVLLSQGKLKQIVFAMIIMFLAKVGLNEWLVPISSITGSALATVISLFIFTLFVYVHLKEVRLFQTIRWYAATIATIGMAIYLIVMKWLVYPMFDFSRIGLLCYVVFVVFSGAFIYLVSLLRFGALTERQISNLPLSSAFLKLHDVLQRK